MNAVDRLKIDYDFSKMQGIFNRAQELNDFARERAETVLDLVRDREKYFCPPGCNECCYGSILMSYTEFTFIMLYLQAHWSREQIENLFRERIGLLQNEESLLCPFLAEEAKTRHCRIYAARPLICRVFGTSASPCNRSINSTHFPEELFYRAYDLFYYGGSQFIALNLDEKWSLFEAPFALWCLADDSKESRRFLREFILEKGDSLRAVLYDQQAKTFFHYARGQKVIMPT